MAWTIRIISEAELQAEERGDRRATAYWERGLWSIEFTGTWSAYDQLFGGCDIDGGRERAFGYMRGVEAVLAVEARRPRRRHTAPNVCERRVAR